MLSSFRRPWGTSSGPSSFAEGGGPAGALRVPRVLTLALAALVAGCAAAARPPAPASLDGACVVDLSYAFDADTIFWPTEEGFVLEQEHAGVTDGGYYYAANRLRTAEHGGTHVDAPRHFAAGGRSVDAIPVAQLVGPGVVVDVTAAARANRDYEVTVEDFRAWERAHGRLPDGAIVLLRTGFGERWPDRARYLGTAARGPAAVAELHFPGLHPAAARWLVAERRLRAIGLDTASIDTGQSTRFASHVTLFAHDVPAFENVANLGVLPPTGFTVIALPMKIRGGSGGPLRVVALLPSAPAGAASACSRWPAAEASTSGLSPHGAAR